jgi:hypothetical protein
MNDFILKISERAQIFASPMAQINLATALFLSIFIQMIISRELLEE